MKYLPLFTLLSIVCSPLFSQREKVASYFGVQYRTIIPSNFGGPKEFSMTKKEYTASITQTTGYSFGATVRVGITPLIAFETGINFTQRNFNLGMSVADTTTGAPIITAKDHWSLINYEIPLNALIYIQLSQKFYMNSSMGVVATFSPTDIQKRTETGGINSFFNYASVYKTGLNLNANVGFEYRTKNRGFYYIGGSIRVPLAPIFVWGSWHEIQKQTESTFLRGTMRGSYLSVDLKYFFPNIKQKGTQPIKPPIE